MRKGKELALELGLVVKQALFSEWGNFYAAITKYPCVLFDDGGYILINNEIELTQLGIKLGKRTNVPQRISSLKNYVSMPAILAPSPDEISGKYSEGALTEIKVNKYERNHAARKSCLDYYGYACACCDVHLEKIYGDIAKEFIHVHHIKPISEIKKEYKIDPIKDLRPVCPNCHAILHLKKPALSISELREILSKG